MKISKYLIGWDVDYEEAGIYSLVDNKGKRYIGQARNIKKRLDTHRIEFNKISKGNLNTPEGIKLIEAIQKGTVFTVEILKKIDFKESTVRNLRKWEEYYLEYYGGIDNTYNTACIPYYNSDVYDYIDLIIKLNTKTNADIIAKLESVPNMQGYIKGLIRRDMHKEKPLN